MTVFMTQTKEQTMEVLMRPERRRRWSVEEKVALVQESFEAGKSVSLVARQHGLNSNQLFRWRKLYQNGSLSAVSAGEQVVPAFELNEALNQIKALQRLVGKQTMEIEILREAVQYGRAKKWSARLPLQLEGTL
jgi:transposase